MKVKFSKQKRARFCRFLAQYGTKTKACEAVGISYPTFKKHYNENMQFQEAVDAALEEYADVLEMEAHRRAVEGIDEPVYQMGQLIGHKRNYSDSLLKMKLTAARPEKYSTKSTIKHEGTVNHKVEVEAKQKLMERFNDIIDATPKPKALPKESEVIDIATILPQNPVVPAQTDQ